MSFLKAALYFTMMILSPFVMISNRFIAVGAIKEKMGLALQEMLGGEDGVDIRLYILVSFSISYKYKLLNRIASITAMNKDIYKTLIEYKKEAATLNPDEDKKEMAEILISLREISKQLGKNEISLSSCIENYNTLTNGKEIVLMA